MTNELRRSLLLSLKRAHQALLKHNESSLWRLYTISYAKWILSTFFGYYLVLVHAFILPKLWALFICIFKKHCIYIQRFSLKITQNILQFEIRLISNNSIFESVPSLRRWIMEWCLPVRDVLFRADKECDTIGLRIFNVSSWADLCPFINFGECIHIRNSFRKTVNAFNSPFILKKSESFNSSFIWKWINSFSIHFQFMKSRNLIHFYEVILPHQLWM